MQIMMNHTPRLIKIITTVVMLIKQVVCSYDDKYTKPVQGYRGENAVYKFMKKMLYEVYYCKTIMKMTSISH